MRLKELYESHQVTPAPYLDPKGKAKPKDDYSFLLNPRDRQKFISWGKKRKKKRSSKK